MDELQEQFRQIVRPVVREELIKLLKEMGIVPNRARGLLEELETKEMYPALLAKKRRNGRPA